MGTGWLKMRIHSDLEHTQNENAFKMDAHTQNENGLRMATLKMTKQSAIKIQDNSQNTGNPSINFTRLILTHINRHSSEAPPVRGTQGTSNK